MLPYSSSTLWGGILTLAQKNKKHTATQKPTHKPPSIVIHNTQKTGTTPCLSTDGDFPRGSDSKESICNAGDPGLIPGSGKSPGEGHGNPFQYSCLENPVDSGAWLAIVHGVTKRKTGLSDSHFSTDEWIKWIYYIHSMDIIQLSM